MNSHLIRPICRHTLRSEVLAAAGLEVASARMMLWAMDLTAPAEPASRPYRARNPNVFYHVPLDPLFSQSCAVNLSQMLENTRGTGEGGTTQSRLGNPTRERAR
jgi:hypothetical protein